MSALDIGASESINGMAVFLRVQWSPEALRSALEGSEGGNAAEIHEHLSSRLSEAMRPVLLQVRAEAERNLLKAYVDFLSGKNEHAVAA